MGDNPVFLTEKVQYYRSVLATPHANRAHLGPPNGGPGAVGCIQRDHVLGTKMWCQGEG